MRPPNLALLTALFALNAFSLASDNAPEQAPPANPERPTAIRKMGLSGGEKFFPHLDMAYASNFTSGAETNDEGASDSGLQRKRDASDTVSSKERSIFARLDRILLYTNSSALSVVRPPFAPHQMRQKHQLLADRRASTFVGDVFRRDWSCPAGTRGCENIGEPYLCCGESETCVEVEDTGSGNVGCCPQGATCGGVVAECPGEDRQCPADMGGGCCLEGFICKDVGCVTSSPTTIIASASTSSLPTTPSKTTISTPTTSSTSEPTMQSSVSITATTTAQPEAPDRPTGSVEEGECPTGFYACLAWDGGGCCRTGRDCETTSCPLISYTTIESNGVTVAIPVSAITGSAGEEQTCADGWYMCGSEAGDRAGCCPSGYACGTASCTLSDSATQTWEGTVAKELPGQTHIGDDSGAPLPSVCGNGLVVAALGFLGVIFV